MKRFLGALVAACGVTLLASPSMADEGPKVGDKAPDFTMTGSDGKTYSLGDFKGKKGVVIAWFPRAFTGGCTAECKSMREFGKELRESNVAYFTASNDPVDKNTKFAESLELDYPILSDPENKATKAFGVLNEKGTAALRWTFYIDKEGVIRHIDKKVNTKNHGSDIAKKVKELGLSG